MWIAPSARALLASGTAAPGSLVWRSTRGDSAPGAARRCHCWRARSSAGQCLSRENATPGAVPAAPTEVVQSQKHCNLVNQDAREVKTRFGDTAQGSKLKSSTRKHELRTNLTPKSEQDRGAKPACSTPDTASKVFLLGSSIGKPRRVFWGVGTVSGAHQYRVQTPETHLKRTSGTNVEQLHPPGDSAEHQRRAP